MTAAAKSPKGGAVPIILLAGHSYGQYTLGDDANIPKIQSKGGAQFRSLLIESYSGTARKQNMTLLGRQPKKPKMQSKAGGSSNRPLLIRKHIMGGVATNYYSNSCQFLHVHLESRIYCPVIAEARKLARARWTSWTLRPLPDLPELPLPLL